MALDGVCDSDAYRYLDAEELARAGRFRYDVDRYRFAMTRSVLRELLGEYTGVRPASVGFTLGQYGRPELATPLGETPMLSFNVSHTGGDALIAVSRTRCVGIDIEVKQRALDWRELAPLVCTAAERAQIESLPPEAQRDAFLRCWTAKEAILKTIGLGITEGLLCLHVDVEHSAEQQPVVIEAPRFEAAARLRFRWFDDLPACQACLAWGQDA
ncbi:4'-phosphopantetheinyl transferase family protein [Pandoraea norimbergensis]|uniref:4'-phosphopantetheinyl transferase domain-containing protein n=1 Tax=Pandoraea norimbergensis TaxID=93219 RepID=A0ABN4JLK3_9BURK|nr:4'-phosphopantetheinyl transferase superfamily protein [Pandoraea norimbergensis]ALS61809.1 hypothetical protein AT302_20560 [Pandoraea norimbergensis]